MRILPIALIIISTGLVCNGNEKEIKEIFDIYKKWFILFEKEGFKRLKWPLIGSKYKWLGRDEVKIDSLFTPVWF